MCTGPNEQDTYGLEDDQHNKYHIFDIISFLYKPVLWAINTLRTGDADLRFYVTTVQDG